jgi:hypothetical protein
MNKGTITMSRQTEQPLRATRRYALSASALALVSLPLAGLCGTTFAATRATKTVLEHHLGAFAKGLDEIMKDYAAASVILTHDK